MIMVASARAILFVAGILAVTAVQSSAYACVITPGPIAARDLMNAPSDMIAVKAEITSFTLLGPHQRTPSSGFKLDLRVVEVVSGSPSDTLVVEYGPCTSVPGRVGQVVPVLARKRPDGTYVAPQLPLRMHPSRPPSDTK